MSDSDKRLLEANKKLLNQRNEMFKDIYTLIRYIKGHRELKEEVKEIVNYYKTYHKKNSVNKFESSFKRK